MQNRHRAILLKASESLFTCHSIRGIICKEVDGWSICQKIRLHCKNVTKSGFSVSPARFTGSPSQEALLSDLCLKISPIVTNTSRNNNVLSLRLAGEYWREVCGASRRSGPAFAGGSAGAGGGPCLLLLRSRLLLLLPAWAENLGPRQPSNPRRSRCFILFVRTLYVLSLYLNLFYIYLEYLVFHLFLTCDQDAHT